MILLLQETKCDTLADNIKDYFWSLQDHSWLFSSSRGQSGGLLISWNNSYLNVTSSHISKSWIWIRGELISTKEIINCINIYSPNELRDKKIIWEELGNILHSQEGEPVCLMGDFNSILCDTERVNCSFRRTDMAGFNSFVLDNRLKDAPLVNYDHTWFGPNGKSSRLDRTLLNSDWLEQESNWWIQGLGRKSSDHLVLLLKSCEQNWGPRPFKAFNYWLKDDKFTNGILNHWRSLQTNGINLHEKLRSTRLFIKNWNLNNIGDCFKKVDILEQRFAELDVNCNGKALEKREVELNLQAAYKEKEEFLKQKSRLQWDAEGDSNTRFFHKIVRHRFKNNNIQGIRKEGIWISNPTEVKDNFKNHFSDFFNVPQGADIFSLCSLVQKKISDEETEHLQRDVELQEIYAVVMSMNSNKSPGPDGINMEYYKKLWIVVHTDILLMIKEFLDTNSLPPGINSSFIALIPKKDSPDSVSDFRPISLINCSLKILLKLLANRLSVVLPKIISEAQSGFIKGRCIAENIFVVNEIIHSRSNKISGMILKLDFAKAFDSVKWSFLFQIMNCLGFSAKWVEWIKSIFKSIKMSVLVNGSPSTEFSISRGLRQGDPLSPMLFNIVVEALHLLLVKAEELGIIKGIRLGSGPALSHQQFVDDTIIFVENTTHSC